MGVMDRYNEKKKKKSEESSNETKTSGVMQRYEQLKKWNSLDTSAVDEKYINSFMTDANKFFGGFKDGKTPHYTSATTTLQDLESRNDTIQAWLYKNKSRLNEKTYSELSNAMGQFKSGIVDTNKFYSQWANADEYDSFVMGWLDPESGITAENSTARKAKYEKNKARIDEIDSQLSWMAKSWYGNLIDLDDDTQALKNELEALKAENLQYERTQGVLDKYYTPVTDEFLKNGSDRDYFNTSREDLWEINTNEDYINSLLASGGYKFDEYGNIVSTVSGDIHYEADDLSRAMYKNSREGNSGGLIDKWLGNESVNYRDQYYNSLVQDKLGMFLSATEEDYLDAVSELSAGAGNANNTWAEILRDGEALGWKHLTEHELKIYYDLLKREGQESAYRYLDAMSTELTRRATKERADEIANASGLEKIGLNLASIPMNILGGGIAFLEDTANVIQGNDINPYSAAHSWQNDAQTIRFETAKDINDFTGNASLPWLGATWGDVYQFIMSTGDSAVGSFMGGNAYGVLMGMGAASSTMKDMYERGASIDQMMAGGILAGAAEMIFEKLSIDALIKANDAKSIVGIIINTLKQSGVEASEEMFTEIANTITDSIVMGSQSNWVDFETFIKNVLNAGLGGFISGGVGAGIRASIGKMAYDSERKQHGKNLISIGSVDSLKQFALDNASDSKKIAKLSSKVDSNPSARNVGKLSYLMGDTISSKNRTEIENALIEKGLDKREARRVSEYLVDSESITQDQIKEINADERIGAVVDELLANPDSEINTRSLDLMSARYGFYTKKDTSTAEATEESTVENGEETIPESKTAPTTETIANEGLQTSETTAETVAEEEGTVTLAEASKKYGAQAQAMIHTYTEGQNVAQYDKAYQMAYAMGKSGVSLSYAMNSDSASYLTEDQRKLAYEAGKSASDTFAKEKDAENKQAANGKTGRKKGTVKGKNVSIKDLKKTFNDTQNKAYKILTRIAEVTGYDIVLFKSEKTDAKGNFIEEQGSYKISSNTIYIDINAGLGNIKDVGDLAKYSMLRTFGHEFTHSLEQNSPIEYNELRKAVFERLAEMGEDVNDLIEQKMVLYEDEELTYEEASREVVAEAMSDILPDSHFIEILATKHQNLFQKILAKLKEFLNSIKEYFSSLDPNMSTEANALKEEINGAMHYVESIVELFDKAAVKAVETYQSKVATDTKAKKTEKTETEAIDGEQTNDGDVISVEDTTQYSYRSLAEAAGFEAIENEDGTRAFIRNGKAVYKVTVEDIENSPIGAFINYSLENKDISKEQADDQKKMFAEICTMACQTNDFSMTMQFVGSAVFTAMKANADKQYGTTYDFPSICTKTQAVIDAMSARMVKLGRGLNSNELVQLYREVFASGNPVPCPECYVFSRWIGIGGLLDNIKKYQDFYGNMSVEEVAKAYKKMHSKVEAFAKEQDISFGKAKGALTSKLTKEYNKLTEKIEKATNQGEAVKESDRKRLAELEPMMNTVKSMTWLESVYFADSTLTKVNKNYKVPDDVLFDLNNGETFATKYKEAWAFRTTQGAGYGKAITPYADANLGEGILVTNNTTNAIKGKANGTLDNYFLKQRGKMDANAKKALERARAKQRNQAFIGGQRFQSTSDARYENASDYLLAALEMQAMRGMVQVYTKVDGAVPAFSNWGFSINQSLMPLGGGLDANGNIKDTSVGGMNPRVATENRKKHESAGTITIGVNDNHIRVMFQSVDRDFVIPYHASGGKADIVAEFRAIQDKEAKRNAKVRSTDYSRTQSDKVLSDEVLRWLGKTDAEIEQIHNVREARIAILTRGKVDMDVVRGNRFLSALYDKLYGGEWDGVKLAKSKVESQIYPNEFWDQSVSYDESGKVTKDYLEYCEDLGFLHRFSGLIPSNGRLVSVKGYDENGNRVELTDLAYKYEDGVKTDKVEDFFWKVLTDRRMYDNEGNYLPQKIVTLNDTTKETVTSFAKNNDGRQYNKEISQKTAKKISETQYSKRATSNRDSLGNELSKEQQEFFKDSKVRDGKGNLLVMYHGTTANFNTFKRGDIGFHFGTKGAARGRVGYGKNVTLKEVYLNITNPIVFNEDLGSWDADYRLTQELYERGILDRAEAEQVLLSDDKTYRRPTEKANKKLSELLQEKGYDGIEYRNTFESKKDSTSYIIFNSNQAKEITNQKPTASADIRYSKRDTTYLDAVNKGDMKTAQRMVDEAAKEAGYTFGIGYHGTSRHGFNTFNTDLIFFTSNRQTAEEYRNPGMWASLREKDGRVIGAYFKFDNPLMLDGSYTDYRNVRVPWQEWKPTVYGRLPDNALNSTEVAEEAKKRGYDGVVIENDKDTKFTDSAKYLKNRGRGTTYIAFSSSQVKSADPVTYDDDGNVIPLSERFNVENNDIRYSKRAYKDNPLIKSVIDTENDYKARGSWSGKAIANLYKDNPEYDYLRRIYKGDKAAISELEDLVSQIEDINLLDSLLWYPVYVYGVEARKTLRKAINSYKKVINSRIQAIMEATVNGTDVGMEVRKYELSEIRSLFDSLNTNADIGKLADKVFKLAERLDLDIRGLRSIDGESNVSGSSLFEQVAYRVPYFNDKGYSDQKKATTILHELIHSCTSYAIEAKERNRTLDEGVRQGVLMLESIYNQIKTDPLFKGEYGLKNVKEMIAELSNPEFRDKLQQRSLWQRIIDALKSLLGIQTKTGTYLEGAELALNYMLDNFDSWAYDLFVDDYSRANRRQGKMLFSEIAENTEAREFADSDVQYSKRNYREGLSEADRKVADEVISNLRIQAMASTYGIRSMGTYTMERMDREIATSSSDTVLDYAKSYITWVNPQDFIYATTTSEEFREQLKKEAGDLDIEKLRNQTQPIHLTVDFETKQIVGHEGRHRMLALSKAGVSKVAVIIDAHNDDRYNTKPIEFMKLKGQQFAKYQSGTDFYINNVLPLSLRYSDLAREMFANKPKDGVQFQYRTKTFSDREVLQLASEEIKVEDLTQAEKDALDIFKKRLAKLESLQEERKEKGSLWHEQQFGENGDRAKANETLKRMQELDKQIQKAMKDVLSVEEKEVLSRVLKKARKVVETHERERNQDILKRWRDRRDNAADIKKYRDRIRKDVEDLYNWIQSPDNKSITNHVPEVLRDAVVPFLKSINFMSERALNGGDATKSDEAFIKNLYRVQEAVKTNITAYGLYSGYTDLPEDFMETLDAYIKVGEALMKQSKGDFIINQMTSEELKTLSSLVANIKQYIKNFNRFLYNSMYQHVYDAGDDSIGFLERLNDAGDKTGSVSNFLFWQQIRPAYAFERFGKGGEAIWDGLRRGFAKLAFNGEEIVKFSKETYADEEVNEWEKDIKEFKLGSDILRIPVSYIMGLHELYKDPDGKRHILEGGIRVATYSHKGKKISDNGHTLTLGEFLQITGTLTDRQKEVADKLQKHMAEKGAEWGNYVTVARYGEEQFTNPNYYPINSDGRYLPATVEEHPSSAALYALLNMSFTKQRNEKANNRVVIYSIFDVFANHMANMSQYNAMALPILDTLKWFNYEQVSIGDDGTKTILGSLRREMARVYGVPEETKPGSGKAGYAETFVTNIIKDFNGTSAHGTQYDTFGLKALRVHNMAQVAYNIRVVLQQPFAITRAGMLISYKSILKGLKLNPKAIKNNIEEMRKYSGIAVWKSLGFYDVNISRGLTQVIKHSSTVRDKIADVGMWGAEKADTLAWAAIWGACKEEVIRKQKITPKDQGFFDAVTKLFEDVIYKTQVVDSILTKNEYMRDKGFVARAIGSFMSESTTNASMLLDAVDKYNLDLKRGMSKRDAWQKNGKMIGRRLYVYGVGAVLISIATAFVDALRDDDDYEEWYEKWLDAFGGNVFDELMPFNKLPIVSDFYDLAKEIASIFGADTYGNPPQSVIMQWYDSLINGTEIIADKIMGEDSNYTWYGGIAKLLQAASSMTGLPMASATREAITLWNNTVGAMAPSLKVHSYEPSEMSKIRNAYTEGNLTYEEAVQHLLEQGLVDTEDEAYFTVQGWEAGEGYSRYDKIFDAVLKGESIDEAMTELTSHGYTEKDVQSSIKSQVGKWYYDSESDVRITKQQAIQMLKKYTDMSDDEITSTINKWSCEVVTGIKYNDIDDEFLKGNITSSRAIEMYMRYGGLTKDEATEKIEVLKFVKEHPEMEGISYSAVNGYNTYCKPNGVPIETFYKAWKYKGTLSGTVKEQMMDYINSLNLSSRQKDSLYLAFGWAESKLYQAPWH